MTTTLYKFLYTLVYKICTNTSYIDRYIYVYIKYMQVQILKTVQYKDSRFKIQEHQDQDIKISRSQDKCLVYC